jgi:hypothetical protein
VVDHVVVEGLNQFQWFEWKLRQLEVFLTGNI